LLEQLGLCEEAEGQHVEVVHGRPTDKGTQVMVACKTLQGFKKQWARQTRGYVLLFSRQ
jgi:hypothetical protein